MPEAAGTKIKQYFEEEGFVRTGEFLDSEFERLVVLSYKGNGDSLVSQIWSVLKCYSQ
jgi:hypothetical protein